jgi:hypothetical protein
MSWDWGRVVGRLGSARHTELWPGMTLEWGWESSSRLADENKFIVGLFEQHNLGFQIQYSSCIHCVSVFISKYLP